MIRLAVVTGILLVALVVVRRRTRRGPSAESLRVTSRTGISRGVMAAVLEVEERRFLVTITPSSTTLVAELGSTVASEPAASPAVVAADAHATLAAPVVAGAAARAAAPTPTATPAAPARTPADGGGTFLDRIRARTVRTYDAELAARAAAGR